MYVLFCEYQADNLIVHSWIVPDYGYVTRRGRGAMASLAPLFLPPMDIKIKMILEGINQVRTLKI